MLPSSLSQTNDPEFDKIWGTVDPNESGFVSFESFLDFMRKETVDEDSSEQILQSFRILAEDKVSTWM